MPLFFLCFRFTGPVHLKLQSPSRILVYWSVTIVIPDQGMRGVPTFLANLPFSGEDLQFLVAEISNLGMSAPTLPQNCLEETIIYTLDASELKKFKNIFKQIISWPNILRKKSTNTSWLCQTPSTLPGTSRMSSRWHTTQSRARRCGRRCPRPSSWRSSLPLGPLVFVWDFGDHFGDHFGITDHHWSSSNRV